MIDICLFAKVSDLLKTVIRDAGTDIICYICNHKIDDMEIIRACEFRANQTAFLKRAQGGETIILSSRLGAFKITPVTAEDSLTARICNGLREVKLIESGKLPVKSAQSFLNEL